MRLDDPQSVREQYAREDNLRARQALYDEVSGPDPHEVLWQTITEWGPRDVLEVGGGPGELSARMQTELEAHVRYVDVSPGMVDLARSRGVDAREGRVMDWLYLAGFIVLLAFTPDMARAWEHARRFFQGE